MPLRRRLCQQASLSPCHNGSKWLWITDDVLHDAFTRFAGSSQGSRRHGSNVPGPLEAQRRLAKRRMMGLANAGSHMTVDPAIMFGSRGPRMENMIWQPPISHTKAEPVIEEIPWVDRMFNRQQETSAEAASSAHDAQGLLDSSLDNTRRAPRAKSKVMRAFDLCDQLRTASVAQMVDLMLKAVAEGLDHVDFCKRAFRAILYEREVKWNQVMEFLLNPTLNVPEAQHLTYLVAETGKRNLSPSEFAAVKKLVEGCLKLGLSTDEELPNLINAANQTVKLLWQRIAERESLEVDSPNSLLDAIIRGLVNCRVQTMYPETARKILEQTPQRSILAPLRFELYRFAYPPKLDRRKDEIEDDLAECLTMWTLQSCQLVGVSGDMHIGILVSILEDLYPSLITERVLVKATKRILLKTQDSDIENHYVQHRSNAINAWLLALRKALAYRVWDAVLEHLVTHTEASPLEMTEFLGGMIPHLMGETLLLRWISRLPSYRTFESSLRQQSLSYDEEHMSHKIDKKENQQQLAKALSDYRFLHQQGRSPYPYDVFAYLLIALHRRNQNTLMCQQLLLAVCEKLYGHGAVAEVCDHATSAGVYLYIKPMRDIIPRIVAQSPRAALILLKGRPVTLRTQTLEQLLRALIDDGVHSVDIFTVLNLTNPWRHGRNVQTVANMDIRDSPSQDCADVLETCAESFSKQYQSSLRTRYRNVCFCYEYLKKRGVAMGSRMSRALVQAGVTNYLQEGINVSQTQIKQVLNFVEEIEGSEIARQLDELVTAWTSQVYAEWNRSAKPKRVAVDMPPVVLPRSSDGLLLEKIPFNKLRAEGEIPRRTRWYRGDVKPKYTELDKIFSKTLDRDMNAKLRDAKRV